MTVDEIYKTEFDTRQRHSTDHTQIFIDIDNAKTFCEKIIEHEHNINSSEIEWLFDDNYNIMNAWYKGVIEARIRRKFLHDDVSPAINAFHNDD